MEGATEMSAVKQRISDTERHPASEFEGEIREFIRRDVTTRRPDHLEPGIDNLNSLIERVSAATITEIDRVISELQNIRSLLHSEGDRVRREITGYSGLSQTSVATMKVIADTLSQLRPGTQVPPRLD
jgi:hypothetical protein